MKKLYDETSLDILHTKIREHQYLNFTACRGPMHHKTSKYEARFPMQKLQFQNLPFISH